MRGPRGSGRCSPRRRARDADDDERVCDECFKSFVAGEARYHHESEDEDMTRVAVTGGRGKLGRAVVTELQAGVMKTRMQPGEPSRVRCSRARR